MRTSNVAKGSIFKIKIDFEKSKGSYIYDKNTQRSFLDFFGMYASLPLGYNHPFLTSDDFKDEIIKCSHTKVTNCEFISEETEEFDEEFSDYCGKNIYSHFHYCSTGALAVEAAIKISLHYKSYHTPNILSFKNSFHGVNSYGGFVTDRFYSSNKRLKGLPEMFSTKCNYDLEEVEFHLSNQSKPVTCVLVEPIQCTAGDIHHSHEFFNAIRDLCNKYDVPLVFDEIQIGFGATGTLWFFEQLDIIPDIVLFGKKAQVSGLMVLEKFSGIFNYENVPRLEVTWNSDTLDMIRSKYIIRAFEELRVLNNVVDKGKQISERLSGLKGITGLRSKGLIIGFDLQNNEIRNRFMTTLYNKGMICNSTETRSIRLRPNLCLSSADAERGCKLIEETLQEIEKEGGNKC